MRVKNTGNVDVFLGAGERLLPGATITVRKEYGQMLLKNPNCTEVKTKGKKK